MVDVNGWTLYMFTFDTPTNPACVKPTIPNCPSVWPPLVARGQLVAGAGIIASKLGTVKRLDGKVQVLYNGHPLYYFRGPGADKRPGDAKGQGSADAWYVLSPKGTPIKK